MTYSQHINLILRIGFPIEDGPMSQNDRRCFRPGRIQREATKASEGPVVGTQR